MARTCCEALTKLMPQHKPKVGHTIDEPKEIVKRNSLTPSRRPVQWSEYTTKKHTFPAFATWPQQDIKSDGSGIKIHRETDIRAQPWTVLVRANIHDLTISNLPPRSASVEEVREWIYLVLTQSTHGEFVNSNAAAIVITVARTCFDGKGLRKGLTKAQWDLCPRQWRDVDGEVHHNTFRVRVKIQEMLYKTIVPLLNTEAEQARKEADAKEIEEASIQVAESESIKLEKAAKHPSSQKKKRGVVRPLIARLFCFKNDDSSTTSGKQLSYKDIDSTSDISIHSEKQ